MSSIGAPWHVCLRLSEGKRICTFSPTSHTVICQTAPRQCRLWVYTDSPLWNPFPYHLIAVLHDLHLIHTDLKSENILLVHNQYSLAQITVPGRVLWFS